MVNFDIKNGTKNVIKQIKNKDCNFLYVLIRGEIKNVS
jgi:hypothetical protein